MTEAVFKPVLVGLPTPELCDKIILVAEMIEGKTFYPYQRGPCLRVVESLLECDGDEITICLSRQCLDGDTVVFSRDGSACRIKDHPDAWCTGIRPVSRYVMQGGVSFTATDNHPVLTDCGWKNAGSLAPGDRVAVLAEWDRWPELESFREIRIGNRACATRTAMRVNGRTARILGYFCTDGSMSERQSAKFTNIRVEYLREFSDLVRTEFGISCKRYAKGKGYDLLVTTTKSSYDNPFRDWIRALRWDADFPLDVFAFPKNLARLFVNRAWSGDGCVSQGSRNSEIFLACANGTYARYWQMLLLKFGVASTVKEEWMSKSTKPFFRLCVACGAINVRRFFREFGPIYGKEDRCKTVLDYHDSRLGRGGKGQDEREMRRIAKTGKDGEKIAFAALKRFERLGRREVWDIRVPDKGWFVAQGAVVHNSGKTTGIAATIGACMVLFPQLAELWPDDVRFNRKDDAGTYRGWRDGFHAGAYAPTSKQVLFVYNRLCTAFSRKETVAMLAGMGIQVPTMNASTLALSNGSSCFAGSAGPQSKIEGATYHLLVCDETQDISDRQIQKSLSPMVAATKGTTVKTGTPGIVRGNFYHAIRRNRRSYVVGGKKNHFEADYKECCKYNSFYRSYIEKEKISLGENSDEFRMNYRLEWMLERGLFLTPERLESILVTEENWTSLKAKHTWQYVHAECREGTHVAGMDFGKKSDSTVVTVVEVDWTTPLVEKYVQNLETSFTYRAYRKHVLAWLELQGDDYETQMAAILDFLGLFNVVKIGLDVTGLGEVLKDRLTAELPDVLIEGYAFVNSWKSEAWKMLAGDIAGKRITVPGHKDCQASVEYRRFLQQMLDLEKEYVGGYLTCFAPNEKGAHDDFPCSLLAANWAASTPVDQEIELADENIFINDRAAKLFALKQAEKERHAG